jgi:hypothetical protein
MLERLFESAAAPRRDTATPGTTRNNNGAGAAVAAPLSATHNEQRSARPAPAAPRSANNE